MSAPVTYDPTHPPTAPAPKRARRFMRKAQTAHEKRTIEHTAAAAAIPVVVGQIVETPNTLTAHEDVSATSLAAHPHSSIIKRARELMRSNAEFYVRAHLETIKQCIALARTDPKYLETARRATEFALSSIADDDGARVVSKQETAPPTQPTFQIGIALGGMPTSPKLLEK